MQKMLKQIIEMYHTINDMNKQILNLFNNTGMFDGDPLFQPKSSPICVYWKPRGNNEEELFMNYNCTYSDNQSDLGGTSHCSIMTCPNKEHYTQISGKIAKLHSDLHPITMKLLYLFNVNKHHCKYNSEKHCNKAGVYCNRANCPL